MTDFEPPESSELPDDALDALLRQAAWPESDSAAVERLRNQWRSLVAERRRLLLRRWVSAAAAAVMFGLGVWFFWPRGPRQEVAVGPDRQAPQPDAPRGPRAESGAEPGTLAERLDDAHRQPPDSSRTENEFVWSRPANVYQQLVIGRLERRRTSRPPATIRSTAQPQPQPAADELESAIQKLLADPGADLAAITEPLLQDRTRHERRLLERLPRASAAEQLAIIGLLTRLGSPRSVPVLLQLSQRAGTHAAALRASAPHTDPSLLAELARREADRILQRQLLRELISRGHAQAVAVYLELIGDPATSEAALTALDDVSHPPVELLFGYLNGPDTARQLAAALVLGRLDGPEITQRLIRQALSNMHRQQALVALLANRSEEARRFVLLAEHDQSLFATVQSARLQFQFLQPPQRGARS